MGVGAVVFEAVNFEVVSTDGHNPKTKSNISKRIHQNSYKIKKGELGFEETTNNVAEYLALFEVLSYVKDKPNTDIHIFGDSMLVINQMKGVWGIKSGAYVKSAWDCLDILKEIKKTKKVKMHWIKRDFNFVADNLSNERRQKV